MIDLPPALEQIEFRIVLLNYTDYPAAKLYSLEETYKACQNLLGPDTDSGHRKTLTHKTVEKSVIICSNSVVLNLFGPRTILKLAYTSADSS